MNNNSEAVIEECINKLQGILGGSASQPTSSKPSSVVISQFDSNFAKCLEKAQSICP